MDTQKLLDEACPVISDNGWAFYFAPTTIARGERLGLDAFGFYFLGRGGVLGDVEAAVVSSAFGYFNPLVLASMWDAARAKLDPRTAAREYIEAAHEFGREKLSGIDELGSFVDAASQVVDFARSHAQGLTLFAGVAAEPVPGDAPAAAMHQLMVLRELRGSAHLVAIVAQQLDPRTAHFIRRPEMYTVFGWSDDDKPEVTDVEIASLKAADELTDAIIAPAYAVLDDEGAAGLLGGLRAIAPAIAGAGIPGT
jgi:hypothetical protein